MDKSEVKELLQKAVEILYKSQRMSEGLFPLAQKMGAQSCKRRLRLHAHKDFLCIMHIRSDSFDIFGINIDNQAHSVSINEPNSFQQLFNGVLEKSEKEYDELHTIANKLVVSNAKHFANYLYCHCDCIIHDIKELRRSIIEFEKVNYEPTFVILRETTNASTHDELEKLEEHLGYKD